MEDTLFNDIDLHKPITCDKCGKKLQYNGIGEYECPQCNIFFYDDYGKVRNYLEAHRGANITEVEAATGVSRGAIRYLLADDRIEVSPDSAVYLSCEVCGARIRSGRKCPACMRKAAAAENDSVAAKRKSALKGFGRMETGETGNMRYFK